VTSPKYSTEGFPLVTSKNLSDGYLNLANINYISEIDHIKISERSKVDRDDILFAMIGSIGNPVIVDVDIEFSIKNVALFKYYSKSLSVPRYLKFYLEIASHNMKKQANGGVQSFVSLGYLRKYLFPLPPLAEQKRIVNKIDELMILCDKLEASSQKKQELHSKLNSAALDKMLSADNQEEFEQNWQRICENFDILYDNPENVEKLRQAILQLAVQGKLVEQNSEDEPASVLIEKIEVERNRLVKGAASQRKLQSRTDINSIPYDLPINWAWIRFGDVVICRDGERIPVARSERENREKIYDYYGASGIIDKIDNYLFDKPLLLIGEDGANLLSRSTPIAFIAEGKYWVNNHAHVVDGISLDFLRYLEVYINAIDLSPYVTGSAQPKMNQAKMNSIPIAIPPLNEQKRIFEKVEQLMGLCDGLESKLRLARGDRGKLMEAVVKGLLEGTTA